MLQSTKRIFLTCFFLLLTAILHLVGRYARELVFWVYPMISQNILRIVGGFFSLFPVAVWELLALVGGILFIYSLINDLSGAHIIEWVTKMALTLSIGLFALTLMWGLNYYSPPMHEKLDLSGEKASVTQLKSAAVYYRNKANEAAERVKRDTDGNMSYESFHALADSATDSYTLLSLEYDCFSGPRYQPKKMVIAEIMSLDGIYVPFTGESSVSADTCGACLPYIMCREIGRGCGFAERGEAEFAAFLACTASDSPELQYSGYFNAFSLCYNALYAQDPDAAREVWSGVSQSVRKDCAIRLEEETDAWTMAMDTLLENLWNIYAETSRYEEGPPEHDNAPDLLTMWYLEEIL